MAARSGSEVSELQDDSPTTLDRPRFPEGGLGLGKIPQTRQRPVEALGDASIPVTRRRSIEGLGEAARGGEVGAEPRSGLSPMGSWGVGIVVAVLGGLAGAVFVLWLAA